jgi:predicted aldo/keto reductase-like oxidoreductase
MDYRRYRDEEKYISLLGLGIMRMPYAREGRRFIDIKKGYEMVDYAIEAGINYFDTAYNYHGCTSEAFIGPALKRHGREKFNLATKMPVWMLNSREEMRLIFEEQLQKCCVDYFDFYLVHNFSSKNMRKEEELGVYEFLRKKKREGRIRRLGFSMHDTAQTFRAALDKYDWDFAQLQINYLDWEGQNVKAHYELADSRKLPVIVMEPVRGGVLAALCPEALEILEQAAPDKSPASWAIRFAASLPNVLVVLSGMSSLEQMEDNVSTVSPLVPLSGAEEKTIAKALDIWRRSGAIPCTACRYCMECPSGVDIPKVFAVYNAHHTSPRGVYLGLDYRVLGEAGQAHHCTGCGRCVRLCPQGLDIPALLVMVDAFVREHALDDINLLRPETGVRIIGKTPEGGTKIP